jgi:hypothetical protein
MDKPSGCSINDASMNSLPLSIAALLVIVGAANVGEIVIKRARQHAARREQVNAPRSFSACDIPANSAPGMSAGILSKRPMELAHSAGPKSLDRLNGATSVCANRVAINFPEIVALKLAAFASRNWQAIR